MSSFEDYSRTSKNYDETRAAVGVEIILGCLAAAGRPLNEAVLLDAGCGTGNYSQALIDYVKEIVAVDLNQGMLAVASAKLAAHAACGRVRFHQASIAELPLDDQAVDGIMINQVLHHLPEAGVTGWPMLRRVFTEFSRVLKSGGRLVVNTCSREQIQRGFWYYALIPGAIDRTVEVHIPLDDMEQLLSDCGLQPTGRFVPVDGLMQGPHYFDAQGPSREKWRNGDSIWAKVSAQELVAAIEHHAELTQLGDLSAFLEQHDERRRGIGQMTFVCAVKS